MLNPENVNGTPTRIANINSTNVDSFMSVPDQYMARGGVSFLLFPKWGLSFSLGGRVEGIPAEDFIGDSDGFRRPGFSVTIEPGLLWVYKKWTVNVTGPVALYRNRVRSVQDLRRGSHGDAAFADFLITAAVARRF